jgi:hypothetical protein
LNIRHQPSQESFFRIPDTPYQETKKCLRYPDPVTFHEFITLNVRHWYHEKARKSDENR